MKTDVLVVGAGPAGSSTAFFLADIGVDTLLIDKADFPREKPCGDGLGPRAVVVLREMGLEPWLRTNCYRSERIRVVAGDHAFASKIPDGSFPVDYGYIANRASVDARLVQEVVKRGTRFLAGREASSLMYDEGGRVVGAKVKGPGGFFDIQARLVVLAEGSKRLLMPRGAVRTTDRAVAMRTYFDGVVGLDDCINIVFSERLDRGYGWIFPTAKSSANIGVGLIGIEKPGRPRAGAGVKLKAELEDFSAGRYGPIDLTRARPNAAVRGSTMNMGFGKSPLAGPGFAAVGDAAGLVSPINGEGTAHALESGRQLASCLIGNFHSAASVNAALQSYTESMETAYSGYFRWSWAFHRFFGSYRRIRRLVARAGRDEQVAEALAGLLSNTSPPAALVKVRNAKLLI